MRGAMLLQRVLLTATLLKLAAAHGDHDHASARNLAGNVGDGGIGSAMPIMIEADETQDTHAVRVSITTKTAIQGRAPCA